MTKRAFGIITILLWIVGIIGYFTGIGEIRGFCSGGLAVLLIVVLMQRRKNSAK